ncbi:uncharacterized protein LOC131168676 isoform X2 [Malania oleifera]|uniref:uncharacterized protein LOC131168676 isoform X2 n=1 Tax=Malania oleifera TaxID=397392 RepID=UPI0025AEBFA6|nr:uncharacterized protein LOC131168676 isoform X2 [Malania oleifera]
MFRLHRNKPAKSGEKIDFKFSNFQAIQVPKGWDKLFVSLVSVETGKSMAKTSKALVRNGNCQWMETLSESILFSRDDTSKELEEKTLKLIVAMETSLTGSGTPQSSDSAEGSAQGENFFIRGNLNGDAQDSIGGLASNNFQNGAPHSNYLVGDHCQSNHSSFNSRINDSTNHSLELGEDSGQSPSHVIALPSLRNAGSSKKLLGAEEDAIEELQGEAKMWESNTHKLMLDLDMFRKEFSDQSKILENMDSELSAVCAERDSLNKEVEQLKLLLEESRMKHATVEDLKLQGKGLAHVCELENEIKFQRDSNANLNQQLKRSQESNIELLSVLQELEVTIEKQKIEIENISALKLKCSEVENSIQGNLEENQTLVLQLQQSEGSVKHLQAKMQLLEQAMDDKNYEIENEQTSNKQNLLDIEAAYKWKLSAKEEEIGRLEAKLSESLKERQLEKIVSVNEANLISDIEALKEKVQELERDCNELTEENLDLVIKLKESKNNTVRVGPSFDFSSGEQFKLFSNSESEASELKSQVYQLEEELKEEVLVEDQLAAFETPSILLELFKQIEIAFSQLNKPWHNISPRVNRKANFFYLDKLVNLTVTDVIGNEGHARSILNHLTELNKLLEARIADCEEILKHNEIEIREEDRNVVETQKKMEDYITKVNNLSLSIQELESLKMDLEFEITYLGKELDEKRSKIVELEADLLSKEEEIEVFRQRQGELQAEVSNLQNEKNKVEESTEIVQTEPSITSNYLEDLRNDPVMPGESANSHAASSEILERKYSEIENGKREPVLHLSELEQENMLLCQRISGLEDQLRCLTDERESNQLELENSKSVAMSLQDEIKMLELEMEAQKEDLKWTLKDLQSQLSEAREEGEYLKNANKNLQATAESMREECSSLQKSHGELKKQKLELHEHCAHLEAELRESQICLTDYSRRFEDLESNLCSALQDFSSKENFLNSELDALLLENKKLKEAVDEVNRLRADKVRLEYTLQEVQSKVYLTENELNRIKKESEKKVQELMNELAASEQKLDMMMDECEKMENYKLIEENLMTIINGLKAKLTVSESECHQLLEETTDLKVQLQRIAHLEDVILDLKSKLSTTSLEKEKLEASLHLISGECEELKAENIALLEKISGLQRSVSELEHFKQNCVALEEKLRQMEGDLAAREALSSQDEELKNELDQIKRENMQFQQKIQTLEEQKDECSKKAQALGEELKLMDQNQGRNETSKKKIPIISKSDIKVTSNHIDLKHTKNDMVKSTNQHRDTRKKPSTKSGRAQELLKGHQNPNRSQCQRVGNIEYDHHDESPHSIQADLMSKIQSLENELADALEANNMYKAQLNRLVPEGGSCGVDAPDKSMVEGDIVAKERYERKKSSLEAELRDIRERYFHMSLKYAEVEAQREELVMKLKGSKNGKRWFS